MTKKFKNLPSEQIPNDGGWHWDRLTNEANNRLKAIGRRGKTATIKKVKPGKAMSVQFSLNGKQQNPGINLSMSRNNLVKAEEICTLITSQLIADRFTMDEFYSLIGKPEKAAKPEKPLTCGEMLEQYKTHYFKQRKNNKSPKGTWIDSYNHLEKTFLKYKNDSFDLKILKETIQCTKNNTIARTRHLNGLANVLKYFDNDDYKSIIKKYKSENNPKRKDKYIPTDTEIEYVYQTGFEPRPTCPKKWRYRHAQWQFLYSLLAVYGIRVHEAWNIKNWTESVTLKAGEWVAIADDSQDVNDENENAKYSYHQLEQDEIIQAILDPDNKDYYLCIGHQTKTGYRVAFPASPSGIGGDCDWLERFNIVQFMNLPDIKNPLGKCGNGSNLNCTNATVQWFNPSTAYQKKQRNDSPDESTLKYGFTAHSLRHAYNIRCHKLGVNQKEIAQSLGHGININLSTYTRHEQANSKIRGMKQQVSKFSNKQTELERLKDRVRYLEDENKHLKTENNELKTKLAMYEAIKPKPDLSI
ncbi:MAG: hypothetical protein QNJ18_14515 [Xenococcaceae cyanobacterium MO_167.B52]|nr:hypothetical protein [Xenococcaceae cyanobacterium MO_167.B52]